MQRLLLSTDSHYVSTLRPSLLPLLLHSPPHLAPLLLQLNLDVHEFAPQLLVGDLHRINHHLRFLRLPSLLKGWGRRGCG